MYKNQSSSMTQVRRQIRLQTHIEICQTNKDKSATIAIYIPANDERQMQLRKIQSTDKTQFRVRLHYLANRYFLKRETFRSHPVSIRKSAKSKRSNIRGQIHRTDRAHGSKGKDISFDFCARTCTTFQSPESNVSSLPVRISRKNLLWIRELHLS